MKMQEYVFGKVDKDDLVKGIEQIAYNRHFYQHYDKRGL